MKRFIELLRSEDRNVRHEAIEVLGEKKEKEAVPYLLPLLREKDSAIKDAVINSLVNIGGAEVARGVAPFLYDMDAGVRGAAMEILERLGNDSIPTLLSLLEGEDEDVAKFAIDILGHTGKRQLSYALIPFLTHRNPNLRSAAAIALGRLKSYEAVGNIVSALLGERDEWVRFSFLEALGMVGSPDLVDRLIAVLSEEERPISRIAALEALSNLVRPEDARRVLPLLKKGAELLTTEALVRFIERLGDGLGREEKEAFLDLLKRRLEVDDPQELKEVIRGISLLRDERAVGLLLPLLERIEEDDEEMKTLVKEALKAPGDSRSIVECLGRVERNLDVLIEALGEIGDDVAIHTLEDLFDRAGRDAKRVIMKVLARAGTSLELAIGGLSDPDGHVRKAAARALSRVAGDPEGAGKAMEALYRAILQEPYEDVLEVMVDALSSLGTVEPLKGKAVSMLERLLHHERPSVRRSALRGLRIAQGIDSYLGEALKDPSPEVRKEAVSMACLLENPLSILEPAIKDPDRRVRLEAVKFLEGVGNGLDTLLKALDDEDIWVRYKAVEAIESFIPEMGERRQEVEDTLLTLLLQDEIPVKVACVKVLDRMGSEKALPVLRRFEGHEDPYLSRCVKEVLWKSQGSQKRPS